MVTNYILIELNILVMKFRIGSNNISGYFLFMLSIVGVCINKASLYNIFQGTNAELRKYAGLR